MNALCQEGTGKVSLVSRGRSDPIIHISALTVSFPSMHMLGYWEKTNSFSIWQPVSSGTRFLLLWAVVASVVGKSHHARLTNEKASSTGEWFLSTVVWKRVPGHSSHFQKMSRLPRIEVIKWIWNLGPFAAMERTVCFVHYRIFST